MSTLSPDGHNVVALLYPGCTVAEIAPVTTRLADGGAQVRHVAVDDAVIVDRSGLGLQPDTRVAEVERADVDALIIPGGDPERIMGEPVVQTLVAEVHRSGGIVAGICAGVLVMADAGLLAGRSITHNYRPPWAPAAVVDFVAPLFDGVHVEEDRTVGVVVDDRLITALPNATVEFTLAVCSGLGLYDTVQADRIRRHLHGEFVAELHPPTP